MLPKMGRKVRSSLFSKQNRMIFMKDLKKQASAKKRKACLKYFIPLWEVRLYSSFVPKYIIRLQAIIMKEQIISPCIPEFINFPNPCPIARPVIGAILIVMIAGLNSFKGNGLKVHFLYNIKFADSIMKQELIEIKNVWKKYDMGKAEALVVLKEINLEIYKGEFIAIIGPSGSGKSTMMNIVGALDIPSWGTVKLKGKNISEMDESELATLRGRTIGFIFQQFNLLPTLSALKNVMLPMEMIDAEPAAAESRAKELIEMLGL